MEYETGNVILYNILYINITFVNSIIILICYFLRNIILDINIIHNTL